MTAAHSAARHGLSERTNDVAQIMPTVSAWDQHFVLLHPMPDGGLDLGTAFNTAEVREFYVNRCANEDLIRTHGFKEVGTHWYRLVDTRGEFKQNKTGGSRNPRVAVLFPNWTDGIIGEIMWTEPDDAKMPTDWRLEGELGHRLEELEAGWRSGDLDAKLVPFEPDTRSVIRIAEVGGDRRTRIVARTNAELKAAWAAPEGGRVIELERMDRVVTHFYVFCAWRMVLQLPDRKVEREMASLYPVSERGLFRGELSYSLEVRLD